MTDREKLLEILDVPIYPHENVDPLEAVADYLLDNDVVPVVRCKDCKWRQQDDVNRNFCGLGDFYCGDTDYCSRGERKDND